MWAGSVGLLQHYFRVLHVALHKVNPEVNSDRRLDLAPFEWVFKHPDRLWEGYMVRLGFLCGVVVGGGGIPLSYPSNIALDMEVILQVSQRQVRCTLQAEDPLS